MVSLLISALAVTSAQVSPVMIGVISNVLLAIIGYFMAKLKYQQEANAAAAAVKVEEVKLAAQEAARKVEEVRAETHQAAVRVREVKRTLDTSNNETAAKLEGLAKVAQSTHTLVNSAMTVQLRMNMIVTRRLAVMTKDTETAAADEAAANLAERLYDEHIAKQEEVNRQPGTDAEKSGVIPVYRPPA